MQLPMCGKLTTLRHFPLACNPGCENFFSQSVSKSLSLFDCGLKRKRSEFSRKFRKGTKCFFFSRSNITWKWLCRKQLGLGKRDEELLWIRGVEDSCKRRLRGLGRPGSPERSEEDLSI